MSVPSQTTELQRQAAASGGCEEPLSIFPLPLTLLERFLMQCDTRQSPMVIRVVLRFTGDADEEILVNTLNHAVSRHPLLSCRIGKKDGELNWVHGTPEPIRVSYAKGSIFEPHSGHVEKSIDLSETAGLHTELVMMEDGVKVVMDAHHAVTDGNGLRQVITDWLHLYHCAVGDLVPRLPVIDRDRLQQRHRFPQPAAVDPISFRDAVRNLIVTIKGRTSRWTRAARSGREHQKAAHSYCVEHLLTSDQNDQVQHRIREWGVTLNTLVMASCMSTFAQQSPCKSPGKHITVLNPTDLRLPSDRTLPATNRFGFAFVRRRRADCLSPAQMIQSIHDEMLYVRSNYIGAEFIKGLSTVFRIPGGFKMLQWLGLFVPSMQWTCLGDVTRGGRRLMLWKDGSLNFGSLKLATATAFASLSDQVPLSIATCEAGSRITLTVRSSPAFISAEATNSFAAALVDQICAFDLPAKESAGKVCEESQGC